jgi:hypothetical protein
MKILKNKSIVIVVACLCLATGCQKSPSLAHAHILRTYELGSKLNAATDIGLSYSEFRNTLIDFVGAADVTLEMWPKDLSPNARQELIDAKQVWLFTEILWKDKIGNAKYENLTILGMPDRLAQRLIDNIPERLRQDFSLSEGYYLKDSSSGGTGKHLAYENIGVALGVGAKEFHKSRLVVLQYLR